MNIKFPPSMPMNRFLSSLGIAALASFVAISTVRAQTTILYTTLEDFTQFPGLSETPATAATSADFYSVDNTVNGVGNSTAAGGAGTNGSLQVNIPAGGAWGPIAGGGFPGLTSDAFAAMFPGSIRPWSAESGYGAGTMTPASGTLSLDIYTGNLTSWYGFGINLNYNGNWETFFASSSTTFVGADGSTWTHYEIPYTTNSVDASLSYLGITLAENIDSVNAGSTIYIDNIQVTATAVPEPTTTVMLLIGGLSVTFLFRRRNSTRLLTV